MHPSFFIHCHNARNLWNWIPQLIGEDLTKFNEISELIRWSARLPKKNQGCQCLVSLIFYGIWELWKGRNSIIFNGMVFSPELCVKSVRQWVQNLNFMFTGRCSNSIQELQLLNFFFSNSNCKTGTEVF